jgi:hypothetical protein
MFCTHRETGLEISEHGFDLVRTLRVLAEARLADDGHARVVGDLLQRLSEVAERVFPHGPLGRETGDGPLADLDAVEELFPAHVPHALIG